MCRLAYLHFDPSVSPERRQKAVRACLKESWDLGNKDGAGLVTWTPGEESEPRATRDLDPAFVALHRDIAERNARILFRGTGVKSFNEPAR